MTVVLELVGKPGNRVRFVEEGELALAGMMDVERGWAFEAFTEPELARMANRLDGEDRIVVDGATWAGFPELAFYIGEKASERWGEAVLDTRLDLLQRHGRALSKDALGQAITGIRRLGPAEDIGELVEAANVSRAVEALRAEVVLLRDVFLFGRDFGYVQADKPGDEPGFELLEVAW